MANRNISGGDDEDSNTSFSNERIKLTIRKNQIAQDDWTCVIAASTVEEVEARTRVNRPSGTDNATASLGPSCDLTAARRKRICDLSAASRPVPYDLNSRIADGRELFDNFELSSRQTSDSSLDPVHASTPVHRRTRPRLNYATTESAATIFPSFKSLNAFGNEHLVNSTRSCLRGKSVPCGQTFRSNGMPRDTAFRKKESPVDGAFSGDLCNQKCASTFMDLFPSQATDSKGSISALFQRLLGGNHTSCNLFPGTDSKVGASKGSRSEDCGTIERTNHCISGITHRDEMINGCEPEEDLSMDSDKIECAEMSRNTFPDCGGKASVGHSSRCDDHSLEQNDSSADAKAWSRFANGGCNASSSESAAFDEAGNLESRCDVDLKCKCLSKTEQLLEKSDPDGLELESRGHSGPPCTSSTLEPTDRRNLRPRKSKYSLPFCSKGKRKSRSNKGDLVQIEANFLSSAGYSTVPPLSPVPRLDDDDHLNLKTPVVNVPDENVAYSDRLANTCISQPLCLLKGLCKAVNIDLRLFSSKVLKENHGSHPMDIRIQRRLCEITVNDSQERCDWEWYSFPSQATISKYASYQASSFASHQKKINKTKPLSKPPKSSKFEKNGSLSKIRKNLIYFGTNADLSDKAKWKAQIQELEKLPEFLQVDCAKRNMLNHIGHDVFGVNTVQLYMKVPGSRTPGHQENNNFCSVNVNIGPGSCEWFCVPANYWGVVLRMCQERKMDYLNGSWWPDLDDLRERGVPVYQCKQEPGDVMWIGPGTIHWVQAMGWCNNVAWNVGPLTNDQYMLALERYEYNKTVLYKSIVPMLQVSWNLAANVEVTDAKLHESLMHVLSMSLQYSTQVKEFVCRLNKEIRFQERLPDELTRYCSVCNEEVYNIVFAARNKVYCFKCAIRRDVQLRGFHVLEEFDWSKLIETYQNFVQKKRSCVREGKTASKKEEL